MIVTSVESTEERTCSMYKYVEIKKIPKKTCVPSRTQNFNSQLSMIMCLEL